MVSELLTQLEAELDPAHPAGVEVIAYGEVSAALRVPGLEGYVAKRMSGFADADMAEAYCALVAQYVQILEAAGVRVVDTEVVAIQRPGRSPVVYLIQPFMTRLGNALLHTAGDDWLQTAVPAVLDRVEVLQARTSEPQVAIDAQLSNWSFATTDPVLIDIGTPFMRDASGYLFDQEILLCAIPPGLRTYYRRKGSIAEYMDDYFDPRLVAVDLLGNFFKEGVAYRLPAAIAMANVWLSDHGYARVTETDVADYYQQDAATLELFLRVRRLDRSAKRILRREYDFLLPGPVRR